jgi:hypothetical protein
MPPTTFGLRLVASSLILLLTACSKDASSLDGQTAQEAGTTDRGTISGDAASLDASNVADAGGGTTDGAAPGDAEPSADRPASADARDFDAADNLDAAAADGSAGECTVLADCYALRGEPPQGSCGAAGPTQWLCRNGACTEHCGDIACQNDCDCPPLLACGVNICAALDRENQCCVYRPDAGGVCTAPDAG